MSYVPLEEYPLDREREPLNSIIYNSKGRMAFLRIVHPIKRRALRVLRQTTWNFPICFHLSLTGCWIFTLKINTASKTTRKVDTHYVIL